MIWHNDIAIDRKARTITVGERARFFPRAKEGSRKQSGNYFFDAVVYLVLNGWTTRQQLFDHIFSHCPDGGPEAGVDIVDIRFIQWRPKLTAAGLVVISEKRPGTTLYTIKSCAAAKEPVDA